MVWNAGAARWEVRFEVTGFSGFFVKTQADALPLRLVSFHGTRENGVNLLAWETATELNVDRFEIERSYNGRNFSLLATLPAQNGIRQKYSYSDAANAGGPLYYRLKMVDLDGSFSHSRIVSFNTGQTQLSAGPNPAGRKLTLRGIPGNLEGTEAVVYDLSGNVAMRFVVERQRQELTLERLHTGLYLIRFHNGQVLRIIKE